MEQEPIKLGHFLYVLKFAEEPLFKIGISSYNLARLKQLCSRHNIDQKNSFIFTGDELAVRAAERVLLKRYKQFSPKDASWDEYRDGYTEIRRDGCLDMVLEDIKETNEFSIFSVSVFNEQYIIEDRVSDNRLGAPLGLRLSETTLAYFNSLSHKQKRKVVDYIRAVCETMEEKGITLESLAELDKPKP